MRLSVGVIAVFYAGMLVGVSFFATPVKFLAKTPSRAELLEIGRVTFSGFMWVEFLLAALLLVATIQVAAHSRARGRLLASLAVIVAVLVGVQHLVIRQALDDRVGVIMQGGTPEWSALHLLYMLLEAVKLLVIAALAWVAARPEAP